jgi:hypothetical protein
MNLFTRAGVALYGEGFIPSLAAALGANLRTVRRWAAGTMDPPRGVWEQLATMLQEQRQRNAEVAFEIAALLKE